MRYMAQESRAEAAEARSRFSAAVTRNRQSIALRKGMKRLRGIGRTFFKVLHLEWHDSARAIFSFKERS